MLWTRFNWCLTELWALVIVRADTARLILRTGVWKAAGAR